MYFSGFEAVILNLNPVTMAYPLINLSGLALPKLFLFILNRYFY